MAPNIDRRDFLKLTGLALGDLALAGLGATQLEPVKTVTARKEPKIPYEKIYSLVDKAIIEPQVFADHITSKLVDSPHLSSDQRAHLPQTKEFLKSIMEDSLNFAQDIIFFIPAQFYEGDDLEGLKNFALEYWQKSLELGLQVGLNPETFFALSSHSNRIYSSGAEDNTDIHQSRDQVAYHYLTNLGKKFNIPMQELGHLSKVLLPNKIDFFNLIRAGGAPTFFTTDMEAEITLLGMFNNEAIKKKLTKSLDPFTFSKWELLADDFRQAREIYQSDKERYFHEIKRFAQIVIESSDGDITKSTLQEFFDQNNFQAWEKVGLGKNPSELDMAVQSENYTRSWAKLCDLEIQDIIQRRNDVHDNRPIAIGETVDYFVGNPDNLDAITLLTQLLGDQLGVNPKFQEVLDNKFKNFPPWRSLKAMLHNVDLSGSELRKLMIRSYRELSPYETSENIQITAEPALGSYCLEQIRSFPELEELARVSPKWQMLLVLTNNELSPQEFEAGIVDGQPLNVLYDLPRNTDKIFNSLIEIINIYKEEDPNISPEQLIDKFAKDYNDPDNADLRISTILKPFFGTGTFTTWSGFHEAVSSAAKMPSYE